VGGKGVLEIIDEVTCINMRLNKCGESNAVGYYRDNLIMPFSGVT
jgi:hypothetical protein